jgi:hypothetical protein
MIPACPSGGQGELACLKGLPNTSAKGNAAMVIVAPIATVNRILRLQGNACGTGISSIPRRPGGCARLQVVHRDT